MVTSRPFAWYNSYFALPDNPAYISNVYLEHTDRIPFLGRVENFLLNLFHRIIYELVFKKYGNERSKKHLGEDILTERDMENNLSLMLVNTHYTFPHPRPMVPNVIEVGGIGMRKLKNLPQVRYNEWIRIFNFYFSKKRLIKFTCLIFQTILLHL